MKILMFLLAAASILFVLSLMATGTLWAMYTVMLFFFNDSGAAVTPFQLTWNMVGPGVRFAFFAWLAALAVYYAARYRKTRKAVPG